MKYSLWVMILFLAILVFQVQAEEKSTVAKVLAYAGKSYPSVKSPEYGSYDAVMRAYLVERIQRRFGVNLDPKRYSSFDLLEIESFFRCKKATESFEFFLAGFPKGP